MPLTAAPFTGSVAVLKHKGNNLHFALWKAFEIIGIQIPVTVRLLYGLDVCGIIAIVELAHADALRHTVTFRSDN